MDTNLLPSILSPSISIDATRQASWMLGAVVLTGVAFLLYSVFFKPLVHPLRKLKGPKPTSWIFGSQYDIFSINWSKGNNYAEPMLSWAIKFGGVFKYYIFLNRIRLCVTDPLVLKHILVSNGKNYQRTRLIRRLLSRASGPMSLLANDGEFHARQRRQLNPHFSFDSLRGFVEIYDTKAKKMNCQLEQCANSGNAVQLDEKFIQLTLDVIGISAFGYDFNSLEGQGGDVTEAYDGIFKSQSIYYSVGMEFIPFFSKLPIQANIDRAKHVSVLNKVVDDIIKSRSKESKSGAHCDLLDHMMHTSGSESGKMSTGELRAHVITFLGGGHETTSNTISFLFSLLAEHPEIQDKVREECLHFREKENITWDDLNSLKFLTACIKEAQRVYPTGIAITTREAMEEDVVETSDGEHLRIPKGTEFWIPVAVMHRNPKYWTLADKFIPERFMEGTQIYAQDKKLRGGKSHAFIFMPFSAGDKNCLGHRFAHAEIQTVTARLLSMYRFKLTENANTKPKFTFPTMKTSNLEVTVESV